MSTPCLVCGWEALGEASVYLTEAAKRGGEISSEEFRELEELRREIKSRIKGGLELVRGGGEGLKNPRLSREIGGDKVFEALDAGYRWLEDVTGVPASDLNDIWTPEIVGTVVGDILYDHIFGKLGSALCNLLTGLVVTGASVAAKDRISRRDAKWLHELGAHFVTRVGRIGSPGEFSLALREARDMGAAFSEKRYGDALKKLVKTPEAMAFSLGEVRRAWEELTALRPLPPVLPAPAPAPAPAAIPAPPPAAAEVL